MKKIAVYNRTKPKKELATYGRTSTLWQDKGLEAQERTLNDWCKANGHKDYYKFSDAGVSGMKSSRPEFDQMMELVRAGKIKTVLVYSFSRFARSTKHLVLALEEFNRLGVAFISHTERIDTSTPMGKCMFTMIAAMAQLERDLTSERVKNGLKNARAKGKVLGTPKRIADKKIRTLRTAGMEIPAIIEKLGVSRASVYRALKV